MESRYACLIVDDEKPAHLVIKSHIEKCEDLYFKDSAFNGKVAIKLLLENQYDVVFMDINMPIINGIEVLQTLVHRPATIITTAYSEFAFEGYQNDAIDYLLKPISFQRFQKAIEKAKKVFAPFPEINSKLEEITLKIDGINRIFDTDDILYFESIGNYLKVFFVNQSKPIVVYDSLKNVLQNTSNKVFKQTHKSFIINIKHIIDKKKEFLVLKNGKQVPLGRKFEVLFSS
jgi:two-component system, LytTR family, response regulator